MEDSIDITQLVLRKELLSKLTTAQKELALAQLIGYKELPPSVEEILDSDYYLGYTLADGSKGPGHSLYPIWRERLIETYPDKVRIDKTVKVVRGALGTGKTTYCLMTQAVNLIRWGIHPNPYPYLGLDKLTSPTTIRMFNIDKTRAHDVLVEPFCAWLDHSPYFQERRRDTGEWYPHNVRIETARRPSDVISEVLIGAVLSEFNFFWPETALDIVKTVLGRLKSRVQKGLGLFHTVCIDSSDTDEESAVDIFLKTGGWGDDLSIYTISIWEAKKHLQMFFLQDPPSFKVYMGDSNTLPFIIPDNYDIENSKLDKDRILIVPSELLSSFTNDIIKALQEHAGIAVNAGNKFFADKERVKKRFNIKSEIPDRVDVDFFDQEQLWDKVGKLMLKNLPPDRKIYARLDLGIVQDLAGLSFGYGESCEYREVPTVNDKGEIVKTRIFKGKYRVPVAFAVGRSPNQETSIEKLENLFLTLAKQRELACVTTDQYQSTAFRQAMTLAGIRTYCLSVDRNDNAYVTYKDLLLRGDLDVSDNGLLIKETMELERHGHKIDHPEDGAKDISDAVSGTVLSMTDDGEDAFSQVESQVIDNFDAVLQLLGRKNLNRFSTFQR